MILSNKCCHGVRKVISSIAWVSILGLNVAAWAAPIANIDVLAISPRDMASSATDIYDEPSSGLDVVGKGNKVYLRAQPAIGAQPGGYEWAIASRPAGSAATLTVATNDTVTLRPDVAGTYQIKLTPLTADMQATTSVTRRIIAANWAGVGSLNTHAKPAPRAPQCDTGFCHGGNNAEERLNVAPNWLKSRHAKKLQFHLSGAYGDHYSTSCLSCHTVGFNTHQAAQNNGFDDVARNADYSLNTIPQLVHEAAATGVDQFPNVPASMQSMASVQCESCHGAGSLHPSSLTTDAHKGIAGVDLNAKQCAQCHDSATGFQQGFYQWDSSLHPGVHEMDGGAVATRSPCVNCHTGEGFVARTKGVAKPAVPAEPHGVTCSTCHDPHWTANPHQLRVVGDFTLDSGQTFAGAGMGGLCMHCHNSRVTKLETTALTSYRGSHYGPQADMLLGANGWSFGLPFNKNSAHAARVGDSCVGCHMAAPTVSGAGQSTPPKVGGHTFALRDTKETTDTADDTINVANACGECHENLTTLDRKARADYDGDGAVEGIQDEVRQLLDVLRAGILANMPGTYLEDHPDSKIYITSDAFGKLTDIQKAALYNVNFVWTDGSFGIHNTSYAVQLLQRSYQGVFGRLISQDYPAMVLRGPIAPSNGSEVWAIYE